MQSSLFLLVWLMQKKNCYFKSLHSLISAFLLLPLCLYCHSLSIVHSVGAVFLFFLLSSLEQGQSHYLLTNFAIPFLLYKYTNSDESPSALQPPFLFTSLARSQENLRNAHVRYAMSVRLPSAFYNSIAGRIFVKCDNMEWDENTSTNSVFLLKSDNNSGR